jgi:hypothetical protein
MYSNCKASHFLRRHHVVIPDFPMVRPASLVTFVSLSDSRRKGRRGDRLMMSSTSMAPYFAYQKCSALTSRQKIDEFINQRRIPLPDRPA